MLDINNQEALNHLSKKHGVKKCELIYIGDMFCDHIKKGAKLLHFNITKIGHKLFGSTVCYKYGWE